MQISPVGEAAFLQATMTIDAVRTETLAYRELIEQQKREIDKLRAKIDELETAAEEAKNTSAEDES
jgi:hypothetical protein